MVINMKKIIAITLILTMALSLAACGGGSANEKAIVGTWKLLDTETETEYGLGIEFTKDGKLRYGLTEDVLSAIGGDETEEVMDLIMSIEYKLKSDTEMEVTISTLFGLSKETETIPYELNGDTLKFDGAQYTRVK